MLPSARFGLISDRGPNGHASARSRRCRGRRRPAGRTRRDRIAIAADRGRASADPIPLSAYRGPVSTPASDADRRSCAGSRRPTSSTMPGGDPDLIPAILASSAAGQAMRDAWGRGATIAGASAGAMALADWTWTPAGGVAGLGYVPGVAVVPHFDEARRRGGRRARSGSGRAGWATCVLDERTGIISCRPMAAASTGSWPARGRRTGSRSARRHRSSPATGSG